MTKRRDDERAKAMQYLNRSIEAIDSRLGEDRDWVRCKRLILRILKVMHYDWEILPLLPYSEYLKTEHWEKCRQEAMRRAKGRCQTCNAEGPLQTHHRSYEHLGNEQGEDLIVLCGKCHELFHKNLKLTEPE